MLAKSCFIKVVAEQTKLLGTAKPRDPLPLHPVQGQQSCWNLLIHTQPTWLFTGASSTPSVIYGPPTRSNNSEIYEGHLVVFVYCQEENVILFLIPYFISHPLPPLAFYHLFLSTWGSCVCSFLSIPRVREAFDFLFFFWVLCYRAPTCSRWGFCALSRSECMVKLTEKNTSVV